MAGKRADRAARAASGEPGGAGREPGDGPPNYGTNFRLDTPRGRFAAWAHSFFVDHGFVRCVVLNMHRIDENAYRSAQPAPRHLRRIARRGVRTVVNLRGGREFGSYPLEREACDRLGLAYEEVTLRSREAPSKAALREVSEILERIEYPALFHCKAGADRAGLMSALYLFLKAGHRVAAAKTMLSVWYGHVRQSKTGVLDVFLNELDAAERTAEAEGREFDFLAWVERGYDPGAMTKAFRGKPWANWLIDGVLRRE